MVIRSGIESGLLNKWIYPYINRHLLSFPHDRSTAIDIPVVNYDPVHYTDTIRYRAQMPP